MTREERLQQALEGIAARQIPETTNLWPRLAERLEERKSLMQNLRARPALALFILLLALALLTGAAYAVGKSLGYLPGVGIIDQSAPIRVLAEPVSMTREGITVTVKQAALTADQTVVVYTVENVPWEARPHTENVHGCFATPFLRLPDGSELELIEGGGEMGGARFVYPAIPPQVNEATFFLPCIEETLPGKSPVNWQLPLHFVPAPPDLTVVPVIEIQPTATAETDQPMVVTETPTIGATSPITLTHAMQIGDQYVLLGSLTQPSSDGWIQLTAANQITDASGKEIFASSPTLAGLPSYDWGFQFNAAGVTFPITLTFTGEEVSTDLSLAGPPQTWTLQWSPQNPPEAAALYGISLHLDRFIPVEDGYYLIGHTDWTDERIAGVTEYGTMQAFDANGNEVPVEKAKFAEAVTLVENLEANQWVYHLRSKTFSRPLTLRLSLFNVEFKQPVRFSLDLRSYGFTFAEEQVGMAWKTGLIPLEVPGLGATLFRVTYVREEEKHGFEFTLEADPRLQSLALDFEDGVTGETGPRVGTSHHDLQSGLLLVTVLTDGQLSMPLSIVAYGADVTGQWETQWAPPSP